MKRLILSACAALLALAPVMALSQERTPPSGATSSGTATARSESSGGSSGSSGGSSGGSRGDGGGSFTSGARGDSAGNTWSGGGPGGYNAPAAISRGSNAPRSGDVSGARPHGEARGTAGVGQPVPFEGRARGDRPVYGQAVPRGTARPGEATGRTEGWADGIYSPWSYVPNGYYAGYYSSYDNWPYSNRWAYPFDWPYSNRWAYPYYWTPFWAFGFDYWDDVGGYGFGGRYTRADMGGVRFKVKPQNAEVWVDGYFHGRVDAFDGAFQSLQLRGGTHRIEIKAPGYETLFFDIRVLPDRTVTYAGDLKRIADR